VDQDRTTLCNAYIFSFSRLLPSVYPPKTNGHILIAVNGRKPQKEEKDRKGRKIYKMNFLEENGLSRPCPMGIFK
jgi:hypothetical protein